MTGYSGGRGHRLTQVDLREFMIVMKMVDNVGGWDE